MPSRQPVHADRVAMATHRELTPAGWCGAPVTTVGERSAYDAAVERLFARRPPPRPRGLERIRPLVAALGDPHTAYRSVHVTGTNGKTSVARMTAAILTAHGRRTGCVTSPHLQDVRERVRMDGVPASREALLSALTRVEGVADHAAARAGSPVAFFEQLTAAALAHLADAAADVAVLEVGRGGQHDVTTVAGGDVAAIGTVGLDHPELGATVAEVAAEKAGVIAPGATAVCGPQQRAASEVIARVAAERGAVLHRWGRDVAVNARPTAGGQRLRVRTPAGRRLSVRLPLRGAHQATNAALAVAAAEAHLGGLDARATAEALAGFAAPGRLEVVPRADGVPVWLDGAHNPEAMEVLAAALAPARRAGRVVGVLAVRGDKDIPGLAAALAPAVDELVVAPAPCPPHAPVARLTADARVGGREPIGAADVVAALAEADRRVGSDGLVVVTGSLPAVGTLRDHLRLAPA